MKKLITTVFLLSVTLLTFAQQQNACGTDEHYREQLKNNPELQAKAEAFNAQYREFLKTWDSEAYKVYGGNAKKKAGAKIYTIPVVVHVIHQFGSENISDAQVQSEIDFLNKSFMYANNDTGDIRPIFKAVAASANMQFRLARKDPHGNCTNGIVHYYSPLTANGNDDLKRKSVWDTKRYFNMWVVSQINKGGGVGVAGYAQFPFGSGGGAATDGIMVINDEFGNVGTSHAGQTKNVTTATHEAGHYFGLYHPFQGDSCDINGDGVDDTPPTYFTATTTEPLRNRCNVPNYNSCSTDNPDLPDMYEAFMDYFIGSCASKMFTIQQVARMHFCLENYRQDLWSDSNLVLTGVLNAPTACGAVPSFVANSMVTCANNTITFKNNSYNFSDNLTPTYSWTFPGGNPATSTSASPSVTYASTGTYDVTLSATVNGITTDTTYRNYISILPVKSSNAPAAYSADWDDANNWKEKGWTFVNETVNQNMAWQRLPIPFSGSNSMVLPPNLSNYGFKFSLVSPSFDLSGGSNPYFKFAYSFVPGSVSAWSITQSSDQLKVYMSNDCGKTWTIKLILSGTNLATVANLILPTLTSTFVPSDVSKWKKAEIKGTSIITGNLSNVMFKIEFLYKGGSRFYLDEVMAGTSSGVSSNLMEEQLNLNVYPNPFNGQATASYNLMESDNIKVELMDLTGKRIAVLNDGLQKAGTHELQINRQELGLSNGMYILQVSSDQFKASKKLIVE